MLFAGLAFTLLTPLSAGVVQWSGRGWSLSITQFAVQPAAASSAAARLKATEPAVASSWPAPQEEFAAPVRKDLRLSNDERETSETSFPL